MSKSKWNYVKHDSRICFGITYFETVAEANAYAEHVREMGYTYNGGYYHGRTCGRDRSFDHVDKKTGKMLFAVTD